MTDAEQGLCPQILITQGSNFSKDFANMRGSVSSHSAAALPAKPKANLYRVYFVSCHGENA